MKVLNKNVEEDIEFACVRTVLIEKLKEENNEKYTKKRRKKLVWVKPWIANRERTSAFGNIFAEIWLRDKEECRKYLMKNTETYHVKLRCSGIT